MSFKRLLNKKANIYQLESSTDEMGGTKREFSEEPRLLNIDVRIWKPSTGTQDIDKPKSAGNVLQYPFAMFSLDEVYVGEKVDCEDKEYLIEEVSPIDGKSGLHHYEIGLKQL